MTAFQPPLLVCLLLCVFASVLCEGCNRVCSYLNVEYPFGIGNQGCGDPNFQIYGCDTNPYLIYSGLNLFVRYISSREKHFIEVSLESLDTCEGFSKLSSSNFSSGSSFSLTAVAAFQQLRIVSCPSSPSNTSQRYIKLCSTWIAFFGNEFLSGCKDELSVWVTWKDQLIFNSSKTNFLYLWRNNGFVLSWTVQPDREERCSECYRYKGGLCGYHASDLSFSCVSAPSPGAAAGKSNSSKNQVGTGTTVAALTVTLALLVLIRRRRRQRQHQQQKRQLLHSKLKSLKYLPVFSQEELSLATNNFSDENKIGSGGFGAVYKGTLRDGRKVAVKRLYRKRSAAAAMDEFLNEATIFSQIQHPNIVRLYGCSDTQDWSCHEFVLLLLVFEYICNGTLADHLYGSRSAEMKLRWHDRLRIALQIAEALTFLHCMNPPLVHRDVKSSNILLDSHMDARVADFGICRAIGAEATHVTTAPKGTLGYLDPHYFQCFQLTCKSDVYSFGVVLLEIVSGLKAVDLSRSPEQVNLVAFAKTKYLSGGYSALEDVMDPHIAGTEMEMQQDREIKQMAMQVALLACKCVASDTDQRPSMAQVANLLRQLWICRDHMSLESLVSIPRFTIDGGAMSEDNIPSSKATWETSCPTPR